MKKCIAPAVVTAILVLIFVAYLIGCFLIPMAWWIKLLIAIPFGALIGVSVYVLVERVNEIRSGEEDDLSQY